MDAPDPPVPAATPKLLPTLRSWLCALAAPRAEIRALRIELASLRQALEQVYCERDALTAAVKLHTAALEQARGELEDRVQSLLEAREAADQANRSKTAFLASMSHEIRTPMTSVLGFADLLSHDDLAADKRRIYVEKIQRNGRHLLAVIDDILDLSKIEAGYMVIHRGRFPLLLEVSQALDLLREQAERKQLRLTFSHHETNDPSMVSDQVRFRQILLNLVGNALKFTDKGGVTVSLSLRREGATQVVVLRVTDTGIGIEPGLRGLLFHPFSQANLTAKRQRAGTGLGLALARNIAHVLGGDAFLVESEVGKGSTFGVDLPLIAPDPPSR